MARSQTRPLATAPAETPHDDGTPGVLVLEARRERRALGGRQPCENGRVRRLLRQHAEHDKTEDDGRQPFEHEQPLPSGQAAETAQRQQESRQRPPDHPRHDHRGHETGNRAGALVGGKPAREAIDDAGEETGFGRTQRKAQRVKRGGAVDEHHRRGHEAPRDHDPRDPEPRADAREDDVARNLEQGVAQTEDPRAEAG
jgi:hypothetical protein